MKILIVRFSSIGDIVLTTPVIRCLKKHYGEDVELHYLTKKTFTVLLETNPYLTKIHTISKSHQEIGDELKAEKFDLIIDLHHNLRTLRLKWFLKVKMLSFPKENIKKFLLVKFKVNKMPKKHIVERYFETVRSLGVKNDQLPCDLVLLETDSLDQIESLDLSSNFISVAMGTQFETKQMPLTLLQKVLDKQTLPIVLLGGPADLDRAETLKNLLPQRQLFVTCGQYNLRQSAYIVSKSRALLTGDTGLMHIASCYKTPVVSVWGNTIPDFGMYAYDPSNSVKNTIHEVPNLTCRPCSKIGFKSCPKQHFDCMKKQDDSAIANDLLLR